jgi:hypothetical protein
MKKTILLLRLPFYMVVLFDSLLSLIGEKDVKPREMLEKTK